MTVSTKLLATIEAKVRASIDAQLRELTSTYMVAYQTAVADTPRAAGVQITSRADLNTAMTAALTEAQTAVEAHVRAGWLAASALALHDDAGTYTTDVRALTETAFLKSVLDDIGKAFAVAALVIVAMVRDSHDRSTDIVPGSARLALIRQTVDGAVRRLTVSTNAAISVAVYRGYTDMQLAMHAEFGETYLGWKKRWLTTSAEPCPACVALDGTTVGVDEAFDADATSDPTFIPPRVYQDLLGPPRHPNCKCRIIIEPSLASAQLRTRVAAKTPGGYRWLSAQEIRRMPAYRFTALLMFLETTVARIQNLLKKIRNGE